MKVLKFIFLGFFIISCKTSSGVIESTPKETNIEAALSALFPEATISEIKHTDHFKASYQIILKQNLDHNNPSAGSFNHYIYLSHFDFDAPMVFVTEGYNARYRTYELSRLFRSNQVIIEYRFYGKSRPNPIPWKYLKNDQAISDYHNIISKLKTLYKGKYISTGISKGGETVLIYKSKYPKDIDVAIPYVAPLINGTEDPRTTQHINTVGTSACREKIKEFQRALLVKREEIIPIIETYAKENNMNFNEVPFPEALEYGTLEFSFSFWQWGGDCNAIPNPDATAKELFDYLNKIVGIRFYSDAVYHDLLPSYYQHLIELGYYGFDMEPVSDLLQVVKSSSNDRFAPKNIALTYNPNYIQKVRDYVENKGDKILYIYGAYDTWGACAPNPKKHVDALKMLLPKAPHSTRIKHFPKQDKELIYRKLRSWLGKDIIKEKL
ncbi:MAG: hypothetical protein HRT68_10630 [Flavobacteriaceae bacterium]|nr:hypothetical protein [Flavobacteriaceae bacterium]